MNKLIELKLQALKEFQDKYPTSHVGGSIGLLIRGIDLKRDLSKSDLDITIDEFTYDPLTSDMDTRSDANDFDYSLKKTFGHSSYVKMDIRVTPEPSFEVIVFNGVEYNVSKLRDIVFWKTKYANKGVSKHQLDLVVIETGVRPLIPIDTNSDLEPDLLPF